MNSKPEDRARQPHTNHTYRNPVTRVPSADPFVMKHAGEYWGYATGIRKDGRAFGIFHSKNLTEWEATGSALDRLNDEDTCYWAPEVHYENGIFYMYYSVGNEENMQIRVATSPHPGGPFEDSGHRLTHEPFAIDAHVFVDSTGVPYLFYATDFLEHTRIGTGIVYDQLLDPYHLEGKPRPVARARYDWQIYHPNRPEKGGVRWHTVEGPFVLERKGRYGLMFSGGNWQNDTYGVAYAVSQQIDLEDEWEQPVDGIDSRPILKTMRAEGVIGPGHNSVVRGPDNRQLYCVYHRWDRELDERLMSLDRMEWVGDRLTVLGPSTGEQPHPWQPQIKDFTSETWEVQEGEWQLDASQASRIGNDSDSLAEMRLPLPVQAFTLEVTLTARDDSSSLRVQFKSDYGNHLTFKLDGENRSAGIEIPGASYARELPPGFRMDAGHLLRVDIDGRRAAIHLDGHIFEWSGRLDREVETLVLFGNSGKFSGFSLTPGWEAGFAEMGIPLKHLGWQTGRSGGWQEVEGEFGQPDAEARHARAWKDLFPGAKASTYELVVNARLVELGKPDGGYTIHPAGDRLEVFVQAGENGWSIVAADEAYPLPQSFDPYRYQQFRFLYVDGQMQVFLEALPLCTLEVRSTPERIGLGTRRAAAAFDLVRVTGYVE